jgi:hypothetical protein
MHTRQLWTILVVAFIDLLGFSLIVPIIPFYTGQFGACSGSGVMPCSG